jgi:hypothetical protein
MPALSRDEERSADELDLYAENEYELYARKQAIEKNAEKFLKAKKYDPALAEKLWRQWYKEAAARYRREIGITDHFFSKAVIAKLANLKAAEIEQAWIDEHKKRPRRQRLPDLGVARKRQSYDVVINGRPMQLSYVDTEWAAYVLHPVYYNPFDITDEDAREDSQVQSFTRSEGDELLRKHRGPRKQRLPDLGRFSGLQARRAFTLARANHLGNGLRETAAVGVYLGSAAAVAVGLGIALAMTLGRGR